MSGTGDKRTTQDEPRDPVELLRTLPHLLGQPVPTARQRAAARARALDQLERQIAEPREDRAS